jgi:hypothetical protein
VIITPPQQQQQQQQTTLTCPVAAEAAARSEEAAKYEKAISNNLLIFIHIFKLYYANITKHGHIVKLLETMRRGSLPWRSFWTCTSSASPEGYTSSSSTSTGGVHEIVPAALMFLL